MSDLIPDPSMDPDVIAARVHADQRKLTAYLREVLDDSALKHTGRSLGDTGSALIAHDVVNAVIAMLGEGEAVSASKGWDGRHPDCVCTRSMGDSPDCKLHADVYEQRQAGCSCWSGFRMPDGTTLDPYCEADEWHNRAVTPAG